MKANGIKENGKDLDMEIIGLLQELTDLCGTLTKNQAQIMKVQVMILDQISITNMNDLYQDFGGHC